jgi:gliding motility-associated-like protein
VVLKLRFVTEISVNSCISQQQAFNNDELTNMKKQNVVKRISILCRRRNISCILIALLLNFPVFSQNNALVINGAYINLNGGTNTLPVYLVVNQSNISGITRTSGHIHSEGQYNIVKWNTGTSSGNYIFPFGVGGTASNYIPFTFKKTTTGTAALNISTWATNQQNIPHPAASNVAAVKNMNGTADSVKNAIDRFWDIQSPTPVTADLTFSYRGSENTTLVPTDTFKAQHWNGISWDSQVGPGNPGVTAGIGTVGPITGRSTFSPWMLTRTTLRTDVIFSQNLLCNSECTGIAAATSSGGTPPYTYSWNPITASTDTVKGLCAGTYYVTVKDAANTTVIDSVTITGPSAIIAATSSTPTTCGSATGTATATASGGTPGYTYAWNPSGQTTSTATGLTSGTYTVIITDSNNCTLVKTVTVVSSNALMASITQTPAGCTIKNGTATATPVNGTAPFIYLWNDGQTTATATGLATGTYTVTITDANGCIVSASIIIPVTPSPIATVVATPGTIIVGHETQLNASGGGIYSWSPPTGLSCTNCSNPIAKPTATTDYCVVVTDSNGCTDSACIIIQVEIPCDELFVPSAFSPNNDGHNELVCLRGNCIQTFYFAIYNRWGEKVFETNDQQMCWDGTYKGKLENTAVFAYTLDAMLVSGEKISRKGTISLIR